MLKGVLEIIPRQANEEALLTDRRAKVYALFSRRLGLTHNLLSVNGARAGIRTQDQLVKSQLLYR